MTFRIIVYLSVLNANSGPSFFCFVRFWNIGYTVHQINDTTVTVQFRKKRHVHVYLKWRTKQHSILFGSFLFTYISSADLIRNEGFICWFVVFLCDFCTETSTKWIELSNWTFRNQTNSNLSSEMCVCIKRCTTNFPNFTLLNVRYGSFNYRNFQRIRESFWDQFQFFFCFEELSCSLNCNSAICVFYLFGSSNFVVCQFNDVFFPFSFSV